MWVGYPGQEGITSIAKALTGEVNPSGRLVDTYAYDSMSAPATQIFEYGEWTNTNNEENGPKNAYTVYGEAIAIMKHAMRTRFLDREMRPQQTVNTITLSRFNTRLDTEFPILSLTTVISP